MSVIMKTQSAYDYPLLIKNILHAPAVYNPQEEIVYKGTLRFTYQEFRERVARLAASLLNLGIKEGDTVAVMDWDSHRYLECFFAVPMIGAVLHTVNVRLSAEQLVYTIDHAEDDLIIVHADFLPLLEAVKGRLGTGKKYILIDEAKSAPASSFKFSGEYEDLIQATQPLEEFPDFDENTRATTFYTTGTTGLPKGVYFSHRQLVVHTLATIAALSTPEEKGRFHRGDVYMPITPMFHVHAWGIPYIATMLGVKQVYPGRYVPELLLKLIDSEKVTFSHCVPTILNMLLKDPAAKTVDLTKWKVIIGGAALPKALALASLKRGIDIFSGYGMSETCPVLSIATLTKEELALPVEDQVDLRVRTGSSIAMVHLKVIDPEGKEVPNNDKNVGELVVRAPWLTQGYLKDKNNSEKLWEGGWLHTQDVACRNEAGSIRITDRTKDVIKVGGEWLSSLEIEDILCTHPAVAEAAIIGRTDATWGETPFALIVLRPEQETTEKTLIAHVKGYVDRGLLPREAILLKVRFIDTIDKTSVGKVNKVALRGKYLE